MAERTLHFELIVNCIETNESTVIGICEAESPAGLSRRLAGSWKRRRLSSGRRIWKV